MKKRVLNLRSKEEPLLDIVSYGRAGPKGFTPARLEEIARTVHRAPEVVVKVSGGARTLAGVEQNLRYLARNGKLGVESDTGEKIGLKGFEGDLVRDWNLDLEAHQRQTARAVRTHRKPPRLVHNVIFSMPPGTPPDKVLKAVRKLARDEFGSKHRHLLVLHTDEPHPHVHVTIKAMSEEGERLYIRKATLRRWRKQFAANLRELGVSANATERAVRGQIHSSKRDGIFRAGERGDSTYLRDHARKAASEMDKGLDDQGKQSLVNTRRDVVAGWHMVSANLRLEGHWDLADRVDTFVERMPPVTTDRGASIDRRLDGRTTTRIR
jgi:hypothetical protein